MTRCILAQLIDQCKNLPTNLRRVYQSWIDCGGKKRPSNTRFLELLLEAISEFPRVFVVLDAFDEIGSDQRDELLTVLQKLCESKLNLLITTRSPLAAKLRYSFPQSVEIEITAQDDDISKFLMHRLRGTSLDSVLQNSISRRLLEAAQGKYVSRSYSLTDLGFDLLSFS